MTRKGIISQNAVLIKRHVLHHSVRFVLYCSTRPYTMHPWTGTALYNTPKISAHQAFLIYCTLVYYREHYILHQGALYLGLRTGKICPPQTGKCPPRLRPILSKSRFKRKIYREFDKIRSILFFLEIPPNYPKFHDFVWIKLRLWFNSSATRICHCHARPENACS